MNVWLAWFHEFQRALDSQPPARPFGEGSLGDWRRTYRLLLAREAETRQKVDAEISEWLRTGRRSGQTVWPRYFFECRMLCAQDLVSDLGEGSVVPAIPESAPRDAVGNWLLVELWRESRMRPWLRLSAIAWAEQTGLYED